MNFKYFHLICLFFCVDDLFVFGIFVSQSKTSSSSERECCVLPKDNVNANRANQGEQFFRELATLKKFNEEIAEEKMCNLMHFLFQQASLNNKPIDFSQGLGIEKKLRCKCDVFFLFKECSFFLIHQIKSSIGLLIKTNLRHGFIR